MSLFKRDHKKRLESSVRHTNGSNPATTLSDPRPPRVIIHGEDRTPDSLLDLPITSKNSSYSNANNTKCRPKYKSCSIEDIGYLKPGTKDGLSIPSSHSEECSSIPWLDGSTDTDIDMGKSLSSLFRIFGLQEIYMANSILRICVIVPLFHYALSFYSTT